MTNKTTSAIDLVSQLHELSERYPANRWYRESADTITRLQAALERIRDCDGRDYDSDRAWALAMQLCASVTLKSWLGPSVGGE